MKYQFNEQELLSLFYDKENDMRPDMAAPYLKTGMYALPKLIS